MVSDNNRIDSNIVLPHLSYKIMGVLFKVHNKLGPSLFQRAIASELETQKLTFKKEVPIKIEYQGQSIGRYFLDFIVENLVVLKIKVERYYTPKFFKQALAYLRQTNLPLAIIVNFRGDKLRYKRVVNPSFQNVDLKDEDLR